MERMVFVYTTYPSVVEAEKAGRVLVERSQLAFKTQPFRNPKRIRAGHHAFEDVKNLGELPVLLLRRREIGLRRIHAVP